MKALRMKLLCRFIAVLLWVLSPGCSGESYLTETADYLPIKDVTYTLVTDCFIVQHSKASDRSKYPQINCNIGVPGLGNSFLPDVVDRKFIGRRFGDYQILGVLEAGQRFTINAVREEKSSTMRLIYFEVSFVDADKGITTLDAIRILDRSQFPRRIHESVAKRVDG